MACWPEERQSGVQIVGGLLKLAHAADGIDRGGGGQAGKRHGCTMSWRDPKSAPRDGEYHSDVAEHVLQTLQAQAHGKSPNVAALKAVFTAFDEDNRLRAVRGPERRNENFVQDVVQIRERAATVMAGDVVFDLFPCALFLAKKLLQYQAMFRTHRRDSADFVRRWCMDLVRHLGTLPTSYDRLLFSEEGGPSENLRCLVETFVNSSDGVPYDLLHFAVAGTLSAPTLAEKEGVQKSLMTYIRLDFKICWLYGLKVEEVWPRYTPKLVWTKAATVGRFLEMWEDLLKHCLEVCGTDRAFTTQAFVALLERLYFTSPGLEKEFTVRCVMDLITRFERYGPQQSFDAELLVDWLHCRVLRSPHAVRQMPYLPLIQLFHYADRIGGCSQQTVRKLLSSLLSGCDTFLSSLKQFKLILKEGGIDWDQVQPSGTPLVSELGRHFIAVMAARRIPVETKNLTEGLALQDIWIRSLSAHLFESMLAEHSSGLSVVGVKERSFGRDVANLVNAMAAAGNTDLVSRCLVQLVKLYVEWLEASQSSGTLFDLLESCCHLRTVEVSADQLEELSSIKWTWKAPSANLRGFVWTGWMQSSPLLDFLSATMKKIREGLYQISERSLALIWWKQLVFASAQQWAAALQEAHGMAKDRLVDVVCRFPAQGVDLPVLEWLVYTALLPVTSDQPWSAPGMHRLLQRCKDLRQQLGTSCRWLDTNFQWYDQLVESVSAIHAKLRDHAYTAEEHALYQNSIDTLLDAFQAVGLEPLASTQLPAPPPSSLLDELSGVSALIGFLQAHRVQGLQQLRQSIQQVLATTHPTCQQVRQCLHRVFSHRDIAGLQEKLQTRPAAHSDHGESATIRAFIQHFVLHGSIIFNAIVHSIVQGLQTATMRDIHQCMRTVHQIFTQLLSCELPIQRLRNVLEALRFADVGKEVETIRSFPLYASAQFQQDEQLVKTLNNSFQTMQYITCAASVTQALTQFEVVSPDDPDLVRLQGLKMADHLTLYDIPGVFGDISAIFSGLTPLHLSIFSEVLLCSDLVNFFREAKFHLPHGQRRWQELCEYRFQSVLLKAAITSYNCLTPFIFPGASLRHAIQQIGSQEEISVETASALQMANRDIAQLRSLFEQAGPSISVTAVQLAHQLLRNGQVRVHLRRLSGGPSTLDLVYDSDSAVCDVTDEHSVILHENDANELRRRLVLSCQDPQSRDVAQSFLEIMSAIDELKEVLLALKEDGHPEHQNTSEHRVPLTDLNRIREMTATLKTAAEEWKQQLSDRRQEQALLQLFTNDEIAHMLSLLMNGPHRRTAVEKMTSGVTTSWPPYPHASPEEEDWAARSLLSFVMSAAPVAPPRVDNPIEAIKGSLLSENVPSHEALEQLTALLSKLLNVQASHGPVESKGHQFVCFFPPDQTSESTVCNRLAQIYIKDGMLPSAAQIFYCQPETTPQDIQLFMQRVQTFHSFTFTMLGVDRLSTGSRQVLAREQQRLYNSGVHGDIYYVFVEAMAVPTFSWLEVWDKVGFEWDEQAEAIQSYVSGAASKVYLRSRVTSVVGAMGDGKTHHVQSIAEDCTSISINDQPSISMIVQQLNSLPLTARLFINISAYAPLAQVNWIFFQVFACGCLKDPELGTVFTPPQDASWKWYIEVPASIAGVAIGMEKPTRQLVPILSVFAVEKLVMPMVRPLRVGPQERFIARYVSEYYAVNRSGERGINRKPSKTSRVTFTDVPNDDMVRQALARLVREKARFLESKRSDQKRFFQYLYRRFQLFERPTFVWDQQFPRLGSTLLEQFVREAIVLCKEELNCAWRNCTEAFLIADSFGGSYYSLYPASTKFEHLNPDLQQVTRSGEEYLHDLENGVWFMPGGGNRWIEYLAWMFGLRYNHVEQLLNEKEFILTPDFAYKLVLLHERKLARIPVIIEGETGVGKTYVLEMYAILLNEQTQASHDSTLALLRHWLLTVVFVSDILDPILNQDGNIQRQRVEQRRLQEESHTSTALVELWQWLLGLVGSLPEDKASRHVNCLLKQFVKSCYEDCPLLQLPPPRSISQHLQDIDDADSVAFGDSVRGESASEESGQLFSAFLQAPTNKIFHRILIHPRISNRDVEEFLNPVVTLATQRESLDFVVFFDEMNTSGCVGLFKEILMDHMLNGKHLPDNIFFVAAISPHIEEEGTLVGQQPGGHATSEMEVTDRVYFVHKLPNVMSSIKWQHSTLHRDELRDYIQYKIKLQQRIIVKETGYCFTYSLTKFFTDIVLAAHVFCIENLHQSSVSQRDIQRIFKLVPFFQRILPKEVDGMERRPSQILVDCIFLAVAVVYYFRLPRVPNTSGGVCRLLFERSLRQERFSEVVQECVNNFVTRENFHIPAGVALTNALKENIFATIACIHTSIPVALIGAPGSSKTLSYQIVQDNLRGKQSKSCVCQNLYAVDSFFYQCSEHSSSKEIKSVLDNAAKHQRAYTQCYTEDQANPTRCVVILDEAGLPKKSNVLNEIHSYLDDGSNDVSIVALSNRQFDSSNENRMVFVRCSLTNVDDLCLLAVACFGLEEESLMDRETLLAATIRGICRGFLRVLQDDVFARLFSCRDLIHTMRFLRRKHLSGHKLIEDHHLKVNSGLLLRALEENFNGIGIKHFRILVRIFFEAIRREFSAPRVPWRITLPGENDFRGIVDIVRDSMCGQGISLTDIDGSAIGTGHPLASRFKMIIDQTGNNSLIGLMQQVGLLDTDRSQIFHLSELLGDSSDLHRADILSSVRYAAEKPVTVVLVNTQGIHGGLYHLLAQSYSTSSEISERKGYAKIGLGSALYPIPVDREFQCLVVVAQSCLDETPAPFLGRFEKYLVSAEDFLHFRMRELETEEQKLVLLAYKCCQQFVEQLGESSFFRYQSNTLPSLFLSHIKTSAPGLRPLFDRFACQTQALRDRPFQLDCDPLQMIVRSLCAELLQLVPPETFRSKLCMLENADEYADIYFNLFEHTSPCRFVEAFTRQQLQLQDTNVNLQIGNKVLVFLRSHPVLQHIVDFPDELFGQDVDERLLVEEAVRFLRHDEIEKFVQAFEADARKTCCVIVADETKVKDLQVLHQIISKSRTAKSFALLLHFPAGEEHRHNALTASFLNGWSCTFIDTTKATDRVTVERRFSSVNTEWSENEVNWELSEDLDELPCLKAVAIGSVRMSMARLDVEKAAPALQPVGKGVFILNRNGKSTKLMVATTGSIRDKARAWFRLEGSAFLVDDFGRVLQGADMPPPTGKLRKLGVLTKDEVMTFVVQRGFLSNGEDAVSSAESTAVETKFAKAAPVRSVLQVGLCQYGFSATTAGLHCGDGVLLDPDKPLSSVVTEKAGPLHLVLVTGEEAQCAVFSQSSEGMPSPPYRPVLLSHLSQLMPASEHPLVLRPNPIHLRRKDSEVFAVPRRSLRTLILQGNAEKSCTVVALGNTVLYSVHKIAAKFAEADTESTVLVCDGLPVPPAVSVQSITGSSTCARLTVTPFPEWRSLQIELPTTEKVSSFELTASTTAQDIWDSSHGDSNICLVDRHTMCSLPPTQLVSSSWLLWPSPQLVLLPFADLCPLVLRPEKSIKRNGTINSTDHIYVSSTCTVDQLLTHLQWIEGWGSLFQSERPPLVIDASTHVVIPAALPLERMRRQDSSALFLSVVPAESIDLTTVRVRHGNATPLTIQAASPFVPIGSFIAFLAQLWQLSASDCLLLGRNGRTTFEFLCDDQRTLFSAIADLRGGDQPVSNERAALFEIRQDSDRVAQKKVTVNLALLANPENTTTLYLPLSTDLPSLLQQAQEALNVSSSVDKLELLVQWNEDRLSFQKKMFTLRQAAGYFGMTLCLLLDQLLDVEVVSVDRQLEGNVSLQLSSCLSIPSVARAAMDSLGIGEPLENFNLVINGVDVNLEDGVSVRDVAGIASGSLTIQLRPKGKPLPVKVHMKDSPSISKTLHILPCTPLDKLTKDALAFLNSQLSYKEVRCSCLDLPHA